MSPRTGNLLCYAMVLAGATMLAACNQAMENQPRYEAYEGAPELPHNQSARTPVPGTVARGDSLDPTPTTLPMPLTRDLLEQGRRQFEVYCSPCHGAVGYGDGMVVRRGFPAPPSLHSERLRQAPLRHYYDVITEGFGVMYSYRARVRPEDRWAVAAYIRALQLSQRAEPGDLTGAQRARLTGSGDGQGEGRP